MPKCDIRRHTLTHCLAGPRVGRSGLLTLQQLISVSISKPPTQLVFKPIHKQGLFLTLFAPSYLSISKDRGVSWRKVKSVYILVRVFARLCENTWQANRVKSLGLNQRKGLFALLPLDVDMQTGRCWMRRWWWNRVCIRYYSNVGLGSSLRGEPGLTTFRSQGCPWKIISGLRQSDTHRGGTRASSTWQKKTIKLL